MTNRTTTIKSTVQVILILAFVSGLALVVPLQTAHADTYTVTNANDGGAGSLRQAVLDATDGDTITFDPSMLGEIINLQSEIEISEDLIIDGSGLSRNLGISGNSAVRVFSVTGGANVIIDHLDILDGLANEGAGLFNDNSTVTLSNCKFEFHNADDGAAIYNDNGTLSITGCTIYDNSAVDSGGAINNNLGAVTIINSTLHENRADVHGGGIRNDFGTITITNSTLYLNDVLGIGGGIYNNQGTLTLSNSTLSDNYAATGGGVINSAAGVLHMTNNILANSSSGGDCYSVAVIATNTNNLIEDGTCFPDFTGDPLLDSLADNGGHTKTMALLGFSPAIENGDNASCETIDQRGLVRPHGTNCDIGAYESEWQILVNSIDDPGVGTCDLTECTLREAVGAAVSGDTISFDVALDGEVITMGSVLTITTNLNINGSNLTPHIRISGGNSVPVFAIDSGADVKLDHLDIINGLGVIGGGINNLGTLTVSNSTISGNHATSGGGIHNYDTLTISNSTFSDNSADNAGGGIYNRGEGDITMISNSTFSSNNAMFGGGLYNASVLSFIGSAAISNSTFSGNSATIFGGSILNSGTFYLKNTIFADSPSGGECYNNGTLLTNVNNLIEDGTCSPDVVGDPMLAPLEGNGGPTLTMRPLTGSPAIDAGNDVACKDTDQRGVLRPQGAHCDIGAYETAATNVVNSPADPGDGICDDTQCTLREAVQVAGNGDDITFAPAMEAAYITLGAEIPLTKDLTITGLAIDPYILISGDFLDRIFNISEQATIDLEYLFFVDGTADTGGGINNDNGTLTISHCKFDNNHADTGGGINNANGDVSISDCYFVSNHTDTYGGAINNFEGSFTVANSTFSTNHSDFVSGAIFNNIGTFTVTNSTLYNNSAVTGVGGVQNYSGTLTLANTTFSGNYSPDAGGLANNANGTLYMTNNIVADSPSGGDCVNLGIIGVNTNNLIEDGSCSPVLTGDPMLGMLADYGGPTWTMALMIGSPAIDAGDNTSCPVTDQRGVSRPVNGVCDLGAYEGATYLVFLPMIER